MPETLLLEAPKQVNGNGLKSKQKPGRHYTGAYSKRFRPATHRKAIQLLAEGVSKNKIIKTLHVGQGTLDVWEKQEAATIDDQKQDLARRMLRITRDASERVEDELPNATLMQAATVMGISADKGLSFLGQIQGVQVAVLNLPTPQDREAHQRTQDQLDAIMRKLNAD